MTQVNINSNSSKADLTAAIVNRISTKTGNPYRAVEVRIGSYKSIVFPRSPFEWQYLESVLEEESLENGN